MIGAHHSATDLVARLGKFNFSVGNADTGMCSVVYAGVPKEEGGGFRVTLPIGRFSRWDFY